jgi:hypothetical protein
MLHRDIMLCCADIILFIIMHYPNTPNAQSLPNNIPPNASKTPRHPIHNHTQCIILRTNAHEHYPNTPTHATNTCHQCMPPTQRSNKQIEYVEVEVTKTFRTKFNPAESYTDGIQNKWIPERISENMSL